MLVECPISLGELIDKLSILQIKEKKINDAQKIEHVKKEAQLLSGKLTELNLSDSTVFLEKMFNINLNLWEIEDRIRIKEKEQKFDQEFIDLARAVYVTNDQRFKVKNEINSIYHSGIVEVKSYEKYTETE